MERPQHGERRSPRSGAQSSHCVNRRCWRGRPPLHADQRSSTVCASSGQHRSLATAGVGGDCGCGRRVGSGHRFGWHGALHAGRPQRNHHERRARAVRHGARWLFLSGDGRSASPLPHAIDCPDRAARAIDCPAAVCRKFPPALLAGHLRGVAVLHDCRQHRLCIAQTGTARSATVSDMGISAGSGDVHRGGGGIALLHVHRKPAQFRVGSGGDSSRRADLFVLCEEEGRASCANC